MYELLTLFSRSIYVHSGLSQNWRLTLLIHVQTIFYIERGDGGQAAYVAPFVSKLVQLGIFLRVQ